MYNPRLQHLMDTSPEFSTDDAPSVFLSSHVFSVFISERFHLQKIKEREVITPSYRETSISAPVV